MYNQKSFSRADNMVDWLNENNITRSMIVSIIFNQFSSQYVVLYYS